MKKVFKYLAIWYVTGAVVERTNRVISALTRRTKRVKNMKKILDAHGFDYETGKYDESTLVNRKIGF